MKTKSILHLLSAILSLAALPALAQDTNPPVLGGWTISRIIRQNPDALVSTNWTVALAPSYAPGLKNLKTGESQEFGFTGALLYPLGQYAYAGVRADYLAGDFFLPSIGVEVKADLQLFQRINVTPFAVSGVSYTVSGSGTQDGEVGAIYGAGLKAHLFTVSKVRVGGFYEAERWTQFPNVTVHHYGLCASFSF